MNGELKEFSIDFHDRIRAEAHAIEALREEVFVQKMGDLLEEYGETDTIVQCSYKNTGMKVDGYCYDDEFKDFTLVVSLFLDESDPSRVKLSNKDIQRQFNRVTMFFNRCLRGAYKKIEISNESYDLAQLIYDCRDEIHRVKMVLITDGITKKEPADTEEIDGIEFFRTIWDIERAHNYYNTGEREAITVEFADYCDVALHCIKGEDRNSHYSTYLGFLPGSALADMYARWGIRMLDMNVRVFLSARGGVNRGIRRTIIDEPEMFCAYNNGITVFARHVDTIPLDNGIGLVRANDFQIINGGQTTASLYHTRKKDRAGLNDIYVQMKLIVTHNDDDVSSLAPKISEFSNTQNKVQIADLAANQSPHPEIQAISNQIMAPDPSGGAQQTYWFYERARGSFEEEKNLIAKTPAQKRGFDTLRPKKQKFDKIKFAKVWNTYLRLPHVVSLGGQKNFIRFNEWLKEQAEEDLVAFFKTTVALLIMWMTMERIVRKRKFEGYHHNIVTYTLAWFFYLTDSQIDLDMIWQKQSISEVIIDILERMSAVVNEHIRSTGQNVTEYCKKEDCWIRLLEIDFSLPSTIISEYISERSGNNYSPHMQKETEAVAFCEDKGSQAWFALAKWLKLHQFLSPKARSQSFNMGRALQHGKKPSIALSLACLKAWQDAEMRGWTHSAEETS